MNRNWMKVLGLSALGLAFIASTAQADTVKVGVIMSSSGAFARWGDQGLGGIKIYQEQHGTSVNGTDIQLIFRDDGGPDPARAKQLAEELILRDKVQFLLGFVWSPNAFAVADLITEAKMPTIITNAATGAVTTKSPYFVRDSYTMPQLASPTAQWAAKSGIKTAVTVVADYATGIDCETYFVKNFTAGGGKVIESIRVPISTTDFSPFYERVLRDKPEVMFMSGPGGPNTQAMIQQWSSRLRPAGIRLLATAEMQQIDMQAIGDASMGVVSGSFYTETNNNPLNKTLWAAWTKNHPGQKNSVPDVFTINTYDGMEMIYRAVKKFGSKIDGDQVIDFYKGMQFESPRGSFTIDPKTRDVIQDVFLRKVEKRDGVFVNVDFDVVKNVKDAWKEDHPQ